MNIYDQIYNEKLGELIKDIPFPEREIYGIDSGSMFGTLVINALKHHTEDTLQCSLEEYERVATMFSYLSPWYCPMPEMYVALQAVKSIVPKDLPEHNNRIEDYIMLKRHWDRMQGIWDTIAAPYKEQARKFAEDKARRDKRELEAKSKLVQLNGKQLHAK